MEIIELSSYTKNEKFNIAKNHLIAKQLKRHGLSKKTLKISDSALKDIIDSYTAEAGVRNLEREIASLCRKSAKKIIEEGYKTLWTEEGFRSKDVRKPDDRANALAVLAGLATEDQYETITNVLKTTKNSSPYMEYYVLEALCKMGEYDKAKDRIKDRYEGMVNEDYSTLWEFWNSWQGTMNHAWSGGPLVIMSKHFAGITPIEAGYERVKIDPQYTLSDSLSCTVPSVKGLITLNYEKTAEAYSIELTLPENMKSVLYVPDKATVNINSELYYQNGEYVNGDKAVNIEIIKI